MKTKFNESGQVLVIVLGVMILFMIFIQALVYYLQQDMKWTVKQKRTTTAFHLAEAGIDRGYWKLRENSDYWTNLGQGQTISNYNFDMAYEDIPSTGSASGKYTIKLTSHPTNSQWRVIQAIGLDETTNEKRSVELVVERQGVDSSIFSNPTVSISGNAEVHWGPIQSLQNITAGSSYYPRKFSKGLVTDRDPDGVGGTKTDGYEWWSEYDVPDVLDLDFDTWRSSAIATGTYMKGSGAGSSPYRKKLTNEENTNNWVYFYESTTIASESYSGNLEITGGDNDIYATLVVMGDLEISGSGKGTGEVNVPSSAAEEYPLKSINSNYPDTPDEGEYPADAGDHVINSTFVFGRTPAGNLRTGTNDKLLIRGLVYVNGNLSIKGNVVIFGGVIVNGTISVTGGGNIKIFYDSNLNPPILDANIVRRYWREKTLDWPSGL